MVFSSEGHFMAFGMPEKAWSRQGPVASSEKADNLTVWHLACQKQSGFNRKNGQSPSKESLPD
jgi:hypothetical protein